METRHEAARESGALIPGRDEQSQPRPLDTLLDQLADLVAERVAERLARNGLPDASAVAESEGRLLDVSAVAERLGVSKRFIYEHASAWSFSRRVGGTLRFDAAGLERWLSRQR